MSKLITIVALVFAGATASAGFWDKLKSPGGGMTWDEIRADQNLIIESYKSPAGIDLFNACYDGDGNFNTIEDISVCTGGKDYEVDPEKKWDLFPTKYPAGCKAGGWEKMSKTVPATMSKCQEWTLEAYEDGFDSGKGIRYRSVCTGGYESVPFPLEQKIAVWRDNDAFSGGKLIQDGDTPEFTKTYTIPNCEASSVDPVPDKKQ